MRRRPFPRPAVLGRAVLCCLACLAASGVPAVSAAGCSPRLVAITPLPYPVDELIDVPPAAVALAGAPERRGDAARFLPHDSIVVLDAGSLRRSATISLPSYVTPPGLARSADGRTVYAVVDRSIDVLDPAARRIERRWPLDMQALGWPAAVAVDAGGLIYVAGQRYDAGLPTAMVEALQLASSQPPRTLWRGRLGVTHAGIWVGLAGRTGLAVYLPDASDAEGTVEILDLRSRGATGPRLAVSYAVNGPPSAEDPARDRLYVEGGGLVRALALRHGTAIAEAAGRGPLASVTARGLLAFVRPSGHGALIVLASARALRTLTEISLPDPAADIRTLAATPDGSAILLGLTNAVARIDLGTCKAE